MFLSSSKGNTDKSELHVIFNAKTKILHINANSDSDTKILFSENDTVATSLFYEGSAHF
mgnify:CR=1 FL=1